MKHLFVLIMVLLISSACLQAQGVLVLQDQHSDRRYEFTEGEVLKVKLKDGGVVLKGEWHYAGRNTLRVGETIVRLQDLRWVDVSAKEKGIWALRKGQDLMLLAGAGYFTVAHLNILIDGNEIGIDQRVARTSAILVAGGLLCRALDRGIRRRKIRVDEGSKFSVTLL